MTDGREKPGALKIVRAINANHFLEVVNEGFLNLTTIYDKDPRPAATRPCTRAISGCWASRCLHSMPVCTAK